MINYITRPLGCLRSTKKVCLLLALCFVSMIASAQTLNVVTLLEEATKRQSATLSELHKVQSDRLNTQQSIDDYNSNVLRITETEFAALKAKLKEQKDLEKSVTEKYKLAFEEVTKLRDIQAQPEQKRAALLAQMYPSATKPTTPATATTPTPAADNIPQKPKQNMRYFTVCEVQFEGNDEFSGKIRKDLMPEILFTHTEERLREHLKDKDYITCAAQLSSLSGGYVFLTLKITVQTANASQSFGMIEKGSTITFKLINESSVKLINSRTDVGKIDATANTTTYTVTYPIPSSDIRTLRDNEIDKMRIVWGSGYEDYDIYNVDVVMRQIKCIYAD